MPQVCHAISSREVTGWQMTLGSMWDLDSITSFECSMYDNAGPASFSSFNCTLLNTVQEVLSCSGSGPAPDTPDRLARLASVLWLGPLPLYADVVQSRPTKQNQPHTLPFSRRTAALIMIQHREKRSESNASSSTIIHDSLETACEAPLSAWQWSSRRRHAASPPRKPDPPPCRPAAQQLPSLPMQLLSGVETQLLQPTF